MALHPISPRIKKYIPVGFGILLCLTILIITIPGAYLWLPAKVHYHIVEKHKVSASKDSSNIKIGIVIPSSGPYQTVSDPIIRWEGEQERINYAYLNVYKLWGEISEGQPQEAVLEYDVTLPQGRVSWESPVEQRSILPQVGIESNHPAIINQAKELSNEPYRIYQFTAHHLIFSEQNCGDTNTSALEAYRLATGACAGYSRLMVALCRAGGTPARMIIGSILPDNYFPLPHRNAAGIPGTGHAWVEYFSQGNWHLADPSWGRGYFDLLEFNRNDGRHLSYGEHDNFYQVRQQLYRWATAQSFNIQEELTYIITSSDDTVSASSEFVINKKWDGRWINTIIAFAIVTYLLCKIRDRIIPTEK
jgi:hypothetical protein